MVDRINRLIASSTPSLEKLYYTYFSMTYNILEQFCQEFIELSRHFSRDS
jgi:hypothetical protein